MTKLVEQLKRHEGFKRRVYKCTAGRNTIGYGYNLDANPLKLSRERVTEMLTMGVSREEAEDLLTCGIAETRKTLLVKIEGFNVLDVVRQDVLINMAFNMGVSGLLKFKNTLKHIHRGEYEQAAVGMLDSVWAVQVKGRANELAKQM